MIMALAMIFSLIAPGAGHVLTGDYEKGIVLGCLFALGKSALLPLALRLWRVTTLQQTLRFFYVCNVCYMLLIFYAIASAVWRGSYVQHMHLEYAVLFAFSVTLMYKRTQNKFIFTALCGREGIYELMMKINQTPTGKKEK